MMNGTLSLYECRFSGRDTMRWRALADLRGEGGVISGTNKGNKDDL